MLSWCRRKLLGALYVYYRLRTALWYRTAKCRQAARIRSEFYARIWRDAAERRGAEIEELGEDIFEIRCDGFRTRVLNNDTALDDYVTVRLAGSKAMTYRLFADRKLPIPKYAVFSLKDLGPAYRFLSELGSDCVVKPSRGFGGVGVTTGVRTKTRLVLAAAAASGWGDELIIQEQIAGDFYRLVYLDGELVDVVVRHSPSVIGDGRSSVAELVRQLNETRLKQGSDLCQALLSIDLDMKSTLAKQGIKLSSVPRKGQSVRLKTVINDNCANENAAVEDALSASIIRDGASAAAAVGARAAGVDVLTTDPTLSLAESGGAIIEVNTAPGHYWHYHRSGEAFPLADRILTSLMREYQVSQERAEAKLCEEPIT